MVPVDHPGSGWSGSSVVADIRYHDCYRVISGSATTGPSLRDRHPGCHASKGTPAHQEGHTRWTAIIPDGAETDRRRRPAGATSTLPIPLDDGIVGATSTPCYWRYCDRSTAQSENNSSS